MLTEPQEEFVFCQDPYPALVAGLGAGKSQAGLVRLILSMVQDKGTNTAYMMPTYDLLRLRAMSGAEELLTKLGLPFTTNRSEYLIHVLGFGDMIFRSYDRPERIVAYEVAHSIVDELDTLPKDKAAFVWRKVSERNRQKTNHPSGNTIGNVTTPDQGYSGFTYDKWVKKAQKGYKLIKASTASNPFLPDGYIEQIRQNYDPILADMYINGEFVSLTQNKVYHFFDRKKHHTDRELLATDMIAYVSIDFNIGGCCSVVWVIEGNKPKAVAEFTSHDTRDFVNNLSKFRYLDGRAERRLVIHPDASGNSESTNATSSDISIIRQAGYHVDCPNANPFIRDRVNAFNGLFAHDRIEINTDTCQRFTDALESQGYDDKGKPEKFSEHPAIDDWNDSAGYFIHRKFPINLAIATVRIAGM